MIVYHGSPVKIITPKIIINEIGKDFGHGFYTTDIKEQAIRWAKRKAKIASINDDNVRPTLNIYEYDEVQAANKLKIKTFTEPDLEWLELIIKCRASASFQHEFDMVAGKIANDNVGETIAFVIQGVMRKEDAVERLKFSQINSQICFNTVKALKYLKFIHSEEV